MFRVRDLMFLAGYLGSGPGTRVGLGCRSLEFGPGLMNNRRFENHFKNEMVAVLGGCLGIASAAPRDSLP